MKRVIKGKSSNHSHGLPISTPQICLKFCELKCQCCLRPRKTQQDILDTKKQGFFWEG